MVSVALSRSRTVGKVAVTSPFGISRCRLVDDEFDDLIQSPDSSTDLHSLVSSCLKTWAFQIKSVFCVTVTGVELVSLLQEPGRVPPLKHIFVQRCGMQPKALQMPTMTRFAGRKANVDAMLELKPVGP